MSTIRAIETRYKGYRFRSRLEARWAVFLDAMGAQWEYESEGYDLGETGWYLPDFWLSDVRTFVEVKPAIDVRNNRPSIGDDIWNKCDALVRNDIAETVIVVTDTSFEMDVLLIGAKSRIGFNYRGYIHPSDAWLDILMHYSAQHDPAAILDDAYTAARSARFEHGETPQPVREVVKMYTTPTPMMKGMRLLVRSWGDNQEPDLLYPHPFPVSHLNDNGNAMCRNGGLNRAAWREVTADVLMGNICKVCLKCAASRAARNVLS